MKTMLWVFTFLCVTALFAEVLFYDNFDRADGAVGNGWTNIGPVNPVIETEAMKITSNSLQGVRRDFTSLGITSGIYYISWDWNITSNDWLADAFPNGTITYIRHDYEGNLYYDNTSDFSSPVVFGTLNTNTWVNVKLKVNLDSDHFSIWLNGTLIVENLPGFAVSDFNRFTFRAGTGSSVTQYIDNFTVFNDTPPNAPYSLVAAGALNDINLNWNGDYHDLLTYKIYRSTNSPATEMLAEVPGTQTTFIDNNAAPNTDYYYRVRAVSLGIIESDFSNEVTAHLQPQANIDPVQITFNVGYGYNDSTYVTIYNNGNYPLYWQDDIEYIPDIPVNGLVAYYPFDGNTVNNTGLHQYDAVNDGAIFTSDRYGNPNSALDFVAPNSRLFFNENILFDGEMSLSCWVNERSVSYAGGIISRCETWSLYASTDGWPGVRFYSNGPVSVLDAHFSLNTWHHVVAVADANGKKLFIDGALAAQNSSGGVNNEGPDMEIGHYGYGYFWDGMIDDIAIYNRALSQSDVSQIYNSAAPPLNSSRIICIPNSGVIESNGSQAIMIKLNSSGLEVGSYVDTLSVTTNDPEHPNMQIVVTINVIPPIPSLSPSYYEVRLNADNVVRNIPLQIVNTGNGALQFQLKGKDNMLGSNIGDYTFSGLYNNHRYYLSNTTSTWTDAKFSCINAGGHLVTITSEQENSFISNLYTSQAWIGLTDIEQEGTFKWVTNEPLSYINWWSGQPDDYDGGEDYAEINYGGLGFWNDQKNNHTFDGALIKHIMEIDQLNSSSILSFPMDAGYINANSNADLLMYVNGAGLSDGIYETGIILLSNAIAPADSIEYPVVVKVDYTPPLAVSGLVLDELHSDMNQISLAWNANAVADSVVAYKIYRRGRDEITWRLLSTLPSTQLTYIDTQFTGLDSTFVYYRVKAEDWVGNLSADGDSLQAALERFLSPDNLQISNIDDRDILLSWDPVTQTISGLPGTPSCYVIYKSQYPSPLSDFDFLSISLTNEYTHQWALYFQPLNRLFYVVTAYGGDLGRMQSLVDQKKEWKFGELEQALNGLTELVEE